MSELVSKLSDADLDLVAGGTVTPTNGNSPTRRFTFVFGNVGAQLASNNAGINVGTGSINILGGL